MKLFAVLRIYRVFKAYSLKELAGQMNIKPRELSALEDGKEASGATMAKVLIWALSPEVAAVPVSPAPATEAQIVSEPKEQS